MDRMTHAESSVADMAAELSRSLPAKTVRRFSGFASSIQVPSSPLPDETRLFCVTGLQQLAGIGPGGEREELGACELRGRRLSFDRWYPHYWIAVDIENPYVRAGETLDEVLQAKVDWCQERGVLYVSPDDVRREPGHNWRKLVVEAITLRLAMLQQADQEDQNDHS